MILTRELFRTVFQKQRKSSIRGYINFPRRITEVLGDKQQEVGVMLFDPEMTDDKDRFMAKCELAFEDYKRFKEADDLLEKIKEDMWTNEFGGKNEENKNV